MNIVWEFIKDFWYLWLLLIVVGALDLFMPKIKGSFGEKSVALMLSSLDGTKYKVINNIMLQVGNKTTQIDHLVISNYGVFVIETKNYKGLISGDEFDDYWKQTIYKRKEKLYNPIRQNYGHIQVLKELLHDIPDINYISIVAFTTNLDDLKVTAKTDVVYTKHLPKTIKKYNIETLSDEVKERIYKKLISLNIDSKDNRKAHVAAINRNIAEKHTKTSHDICPRCGRKLVVRNGKYGQFKGCSNFPNCRYTVK